MAGRDAVTEDRLELEHDFLDCAKEFEWEPVREMLKKSPDLINVQPAGRWSALHQAAFEGSAPMCKELLAVGADTTLLTRSGQTPYDVAKGKAKQMLAKELGISEVAANDEARPPPMKKAKKTAAYQMNINAALDKEYHDATLKQVASAPISALLGIGAKGATALKKLGVKTVRGLATWKFYRMARGLSGLSSVEVVGERHPSSALNVDEALDKKHETKTLTDIAELPPSALQGLAPWADKEFETLKIKSIGQLGEWKYAKWCEWIVDLADFEEEK